MSVRDAVLYSLLLFDVLVSGRAFALYRRGRMKPYRARGWYAVGDTGALVACAVDRLGVTTAACVAAFIAWNLYAWWTGGGDDDTKRRLRKLGGAFTGTRRTAPAGA